MSKKMNIPDSPDVAPQQKDPGQTAYVRTNWRVVADGNWWYVPCGEFFVQARRSAAHAWARRHGMRAETRIKEGKVYVRMYRPG